jgi:hypothetical protein
MSRSFSIDRVAGISRGGIARAPDQSAKICEMVARATEVDGQRGSRDSREIRTGGSGSGRYCIENHGGCAGSPLRIRRSC